MTDEKPDLSELAGRTDDVMLATLAGSIDRLVEALAAPKIAEPPADPVAAAATAGSGYSDRVADAAEGTGPISTEYLDQRQREAEAQADESRAMLAAEEQRAAAARREREEERARRRPLDPLERAAQGA